MKFITRDQSLVLVALLGLLAICECGRLSPSMASAFTDAAPSPARGEELDLLFIQQARNGRIVMDSNSSRQGSLVLNGVSRHTIWFADRPGRSAGQVETAFFVGSNFTDANGDWLAKPNAALYISKPGPQASTDTIVILTLSEPVFDDVNGNLTYQVQIVPESSRLGKTERKGSLMASYLKVAQDPTTPALLSQIQGGELAFDSAALFIDNWHEGGEGSGRSGSGGEGSRHGDRDGGWGRGDRDWGHWEHHGWGWGWRWCSWGWGWCEGWGY